MFTDKASTVDLAAGAILKVEGLKVHFPVYGGPLPRQGDAVKAVDGVSFHVMEGEKLGLGGERGCGKTITGLSILRPSSSSSR